MNKYPWLTLKQQTVCNNRTAMYDKTVANISSNLHYNTHQNRRTSMLQNHYSSARNSCNSEYLMKFRDEIL